MSTLDRISQADKRIMLIALVTLTVAFSFWMGSRIPNLNEKAMMGGATELEALGFDQVLKIEPEDGFATRVIFTTVNWIDTNKRGMTFGVTLAACLMTLLSLFQRKSFRSGIANAMMGILIGTPLGVCVNCAAPIAKGLHAAGTRLETTLATMTSSPTMNFIVVTMLFSLFPWYIVATKLGFTLLFILAGIPILCRLLYSSDQLAELSATVSIPDQDPEVCALPSNQQASQILDMEGWDWVKSVKWVVPAFLRNFWYIIKTTVPLMFLAGFLGSFFIVVLPWDTITGSLPGISNNFVVLACMIGLALFGTFLPVPIAFDIIVVAILMAAGLPAKYAMVLLFTLGIFSIYSFQIVWQYISRKVAVTIFFVVAGFGVAAGIAAHYVSLWDAERQRSAMYTMFLDPEKVVQPNEYIKAQGDDDIALLGELKKTAATTVQMHGASREGDITVSYRPFVTSTTAGDQQFTPIAASTLGIDYQSPYSLRRLNPPFHWSPGVSTGDVHNDGWPDLLVAADKVTYKGILLYANREGKGFTQQRINIPAIDDLMVLNAALVDINNDGWLDIFVASYRSGNHIVLNQEGRFLEQNLLSLPDAGSASSTAVAFGDLDKDGDLDIVLGNWSLGVYSNIVPGGELESSRNTLLLQENGNFIASKFKRLPGETLTTLLTDFNGDGNLDLIVGNDSASGDGFYVGDGQGGLREIMAADGVVPHTTSSTMSINSADIDNDLKPELYLGQITKGVGAGFASKMQHPEVECDNVKDPASRERCVEFLNINTDVIDSRPAQDAVGCLEINNAVMRQDCMSVHIMWSAWANAEPERCELIPAYEKEYAAICRDIFGKHIFPTETDLKNRIKRIMNFNVLLVADGKDGYADMAKDYGLDITGWTWNTAFADLDNDEWQDFYVTNGRTSSNKRESNYFFRNMEGKGFEDRTEQDGIVDFRATSSSSYFDFDMDGDIDIVSVPANAPIQFYVNNESEGKGISIEVRDYQGNRFGIGSKIIISYGEDGNRKQMRELQASGGFLSFNDPVAHFGLGRYEEVEQVEIEWSNGTSSVIKGPFSAGYRYTFQRGMTGLAMNE